MSHCVRALTALFIFAAQGCNGSNTDNTQGQSSADSRTAAPPATLAFALEREVTGNLLGRPNYLVRSDSVVWVGDYSGDPFLHAYVLNSGAHLTSLGVKGDGPGEFRGLRALLPTHDGSGDVIAFDSQLHRISRISISAGQQGTGIGSSSAVHIITLPTTPRVRTLSQLGPGYVGWAIQSDTAAVLVLLDSLGQETAQRNAKLLGSAGLPARYRWSATQNHHFCTPLSGQKFAMAYANAGRIEIFDANGTFETLAKVPFPSGLDEVTTNSGVAWRGEWPHYRACFATESGIFALHSGASAPVPEGDSAQLRAPGQLHVFNWKGELLSTHALSTRLDKMIALDDSTYFLGANREEAALLWLRATLSAASPPSLREP